MCFVDIETIKKERNDLYAKLQEFQAQKQSHAVKLKELGACNDLLFFY